MKNTLFLIFATLVYISSYAQDKEDPIKTKTEQLKKLKELQNQVDGDISKIEKELLDLTTPDKYLKYKSFTAVTLNQTQYENWIAGGENSLAIILSHDFELSYFNIPSKINWITKFSGLLAYKTTDDSLQKTNDVLNLFSNFSYQTRPKLAYSSDFSLRSQFLPTEQNVVEGGVDRTDSFFAPIYANLSVGLKWTPAKWLSAYVSPLASQFIIALDGGTNLLSFGLEENDKFKVEYGWYSNIEMIFPIGKKVSVDFRTLLFDNYTNEENQSGDIDINSQLKLGANLTKYLYASLFVNLKYDGDQRVKIENTDPLAPVAYKPASVQIFENIGIGLSYTIDKVF